MLAIGQPTGQMWFWDTRTKPRQAGQMGAGELLGPADNQLLPRQKRGGIMTHRSPVLSPAWRKEWHPFASGFASGGVYVWDFRKGDPAQ